MADTRRGRDAAGGRGLYLSNEAIDALLEAHREPFAPFTETTPDGRLGRLADILELTAVDVELLLVALAPDVDSRFEQFYGYLNDDVTRRRATVGLALRLCGIPEASASGRARLDADAPLIASGMLVVDADERPFLSRSLRVPDRVVNHLLGDDRLAPELAGFARLGEQPLDVPDATRLARALRGHVRLVYLKERPGGGAEELGEAALSLAGFPSLLVDAARLHNEPGHADLVRALRREALLRGAGIVLGPLDAVDAAPRLETLAHAAVR
jgi:hypothetical protein